MAMITRYPFLRHLTAGATSYVRIARDGKVRRQGVAVAGWFRPLGVVVSEVPVDDREQPILFHVRTQDYFDVSVQGTLTYRVHAPETAVERVDFSIDLADGRWTGRPLEQLAGLLVETAQQQTVQLMSRLTLTQAMTAGVAATRDAIAEGLARDERLDETGLAVVAVRIIAIGPTPDVEKALQTPAREAVQQEADRATFERRARAVEREAAIGENELANQIELARREQDLVEQRGRNEQRAAELAMATEELRSRAQAEATELLGRAEGAAEAARMQAYREVSDAVVMGLAVRELAAHMPDLRSLVISPDLVTSALAQLRGGPHRDAS